MNNVMLAISTMGMDVQALVKLKQIFSAGTLYPIEYMYYIHKAILLVYHDLDRITIKVK